MNLCKNLHQFLYIFFSNSLDKYFEEEKLEIEKQKEILKKERELIVEEEIRLKEEKLKLEVK